MSPPREEIGIFAFENVGSLTDGPPWEEKLSRFNTWVNERLAKGGRVKSVTQCAAPSQHYVLTTITVVIEYA